MDYADVNELEDGVLQCKYYRTHAWERNPNVDISGLPTVQYAMYVACSVCLRCGRERIEYIDRMNRRIGKPYLRNPIGYPRTHLLQSDSLRAEMLRRSILIQRFRRNGRR